MSAMGIEGIGGFTPMLPAQVTTDTIRTDQVTGPSGPAAAGESFAATLASRIDSLEQLHDRADVLAVQAATGDLNAIHDYTLAATEARTATELTSALRTKALEAFNDIMRMQF